jgi:signal transduction histidine kinase/DNA-binding response OmpR family regulator
LYFLGIAGLLFGTIRFLLVRQKLKGELKLEQLELKKAKEMDQMKTRFFANISHEFRTPLTLIQGPLRQMLENETNVDNRNILSMMERNVKRLLFLINQLLDFSRLEAGQLPLQAASYDIVEFLKKMFASFESMARTRKIHYWFHSDIDKCFVYFDRDKLENVIINLIHNAFKFTRDGGDIYVSVSRESTDETVDKGEGIVEIRVEDTGTGISEDNLPYIFDRYYQISGSDTTLQEGTGIGLALVKDLVKLHQGSVTVTSREGRGSTFNVHLPLGKEHLSKSEMVTETVQSPELMYDTISEVEKDRGKTKDQVNEEGCLLIIDDNPDMLAYLREILQKNFEIEEACNGREGLDFAIKNLPDLVISDVMMPEMDGNEFCRKLKTDERTSHIPVLLLTAKAGESARLEGYETGADDYIIKPFSPDELKIRVRNIIDQRRKLRERFSRDITLQPGDIAITSADERFLKKALSILKEKASESEFGADLFSKEMALSRAQLHRKLKALTNQSARQFIRSYQLNHARQLLEGHFGNIAEIAFEAGFSNPSYFAECFKRQFGFLPSDYVKEKAGETNI